jgi:hypothetical protein
MAGIAWLACAASLAFAAVAQASIPSDQRWGGTAWTSLASIVAMCLGLGLLATPRRRYMRAALLGAGAVVALGTFDGSHLSDLAVLPVLWASAASVVSLLALRGGPTAMTLQAPSRVTRNVDAMFDNNEQAPRAQPPNRVVTSGPPAVAPIPSSDACPYLGLADDPPTHFVFPVAGHRCYSGPKPLKIVLPHQESHCLTPDFRDCVLFPAAQRREGAPAGAIGVPAQAFVMDDANLAVRMDVEPIPGAFVPAAKVTNAVSGWRFLPLLIRPLIVALVLGLILAMAAWAILPRAPG